MDSDSDGPLRLNEAFDWLYLLREVRDLYRNSGAGGSDVIRSHQRVVREGISAVIRDNPEIRPTEPVQKPVTQHLKRALDRGRLDPIAPMVRATETVADRLAWLYGYDKVPKGLARKFAFAEFTGSRGPVITDRIILGLVLFAPGCTYPAHAHEGIQESYYVLSGSVSENHMGVYAPGSMIFNPPGHSHRITVEARNPALLLYAWTGPGEKLAGQVMRFQRRKPPGV